MQDDSDPAPPPVAHGAALQSHPFRSALSMRTPPLPFRAAAILAGSLAVLLPAPARASFLSGEALDAAADVLAIIVLFVVPVVAIVVFWLVHVLPERVAEKRHHPQAAAIQTLCLLSLVFGGLLWPIAWLWAYTKPVAYRVAYGTDKREEWHEEMGEKAKAGELLSDELEHLRAELDAMAARGALPAEAEAAARRSRRSCRPRAAQRRRRQPGATRNGSHPARHLLVLRLADLHQVQVAAVEHLLAGHGRHHPDRRADRADPDAERRRAVVARRAGVPVHGSDRLAGPGPRDRGADRGRQPPGQEGRRAVPHRPDALPARRSTRCRRSSPTPSAQQKRGRGIAEGRPGARSSRRKGAIDAGDGEDRRGERASSTSRASASRSTASWSPTGAGTRFDLEQAETNVADLDGQLDAARSAEAQARAGETQARRRASAGPAEARRARSNGEYAQVAQIRAQLESAQWDLDQTTTRSPCDCYVINLQLRPGGFVAALPVAPVMTLVEATGSVVALYRQNELHQVEPGNEAEFALETLSRADHQRPRSIRSSGRRAPGRCRRRGTMPMTGVLAAPPQRFAVKFDVADKDKELFLAAGAAGDAAIYTDHAEMLHILRKVILRVGSYIELPDPEAALMTAHDAASRSPSLARSRCRALRAARPCRRARTSRSRRCRT